MRELRLIGLAWSRVVAVSNIPRMQIPTLKNNLEHAVTTTILTLTLGLVWGAVLTIVITLAARGLGV